jgi:hypothetical protein
MMDFIAHAAISSYLHYLFQWTGQQDRRISFHD